MKADACNKCGVLLNENNWTPSARRRRWKKCRDCERNRQNCYNEQNPDKKWKSDKERIYGLSFEDYTKILEQQAGVCALCLTSNPGKNRKHFSVDHCHITGRVRGLLCPTCNVGLGMLKDNEQVLRRALDYLCK